MICFLSAMSHNEPGCTVLHVYKLLTYCSLDISQRRRPLSTQLLNHIILKESSRLI